MRRRLIMEMTFNSDEVLAALRLLHPEIPWNAKIDIGRRRGDGPGAVKVKGISFQPYAEVSFDLPTEKKP